VHGFLAPEPALEVLYDSEFAVEHDQVEPVAIEGAPTPSDHGGGAWCRGRACAREEEVGARGWAIYRPLIGRKGAEDRFVVTLPDRLDVYRTR
jgi:hypothetical protein